MTPSVKATESERPTAEENNRPDMHGAPWMWQGMCCCDTVSGRRDSEVTATERRRCGREWGSSPSKAVLSDLSLPGRLPSLIQPERRMSKLTLEG